MQTYNSIIVTNVSDVCKWLRKDNVRIVDMIPVKGIANEDVLRIVYCHRGKEL